MTTKLLAVGSLCLILGACASSSGGGYVVGNGLTDNGTAVAAAKDSCGCGGNHDSCACTEGQCGCAHDQAKKKKKK